MSLLNDFLSGFKIGFNAGFKRVYGDDVGGALADLQCAFANHMLRGALHLDTVLGPTADADMDAALNELLKGVREYQNVVESERACRRFSATLVASLGSVRCSPVPAQ